MMLRMCARGVGGVVVMGRPSGGSIHGAGRRPALLLCSQTDTHPSNPKPKTKQEKEAKKQAKKQKKDKKKKDKKKDKKKSSSKSKASDDDAKAPRRRAHVPVPLHEKDDYYRRQNEFRVWLKLARGTAFEVGVRGVWDVTRRRLSNFSFCLLIMYVCTTPQSLSREEAQRQFEKFVARWNGGQLEDMYYGASRFGTVCLALLLLPRVGGWRAHSGSNDAPLSLGRVCSLVGSPDPTHTFMIREMVDGVPAHVQQQCHQTQHKWGFASKLSEEVRPCS